MLWWLTSAMILIRLMHGITAVHRNKKNEIKTESSWCLIMKILTILNHFLFNTKGGNFLNQRLWNTFCSCHKLFFYFYEGFCLLMCFFTIFNVSKATIWPMIKKRNFSFKFDKSLEIDDKFVDSILTCAVVSLSMTLHYSCLYSTC